MKKFIFGLLIFLISATSLASGLNASLNGSKLRHTNYSTVVEYDGTVNSANELIDVSYPNLLLQSADFSTSWTTSNVTVTADQVNGEDNELTSGDLLTPSAADSYIYQDVTAAVGNQVTCSFHLTVGPDAIPVNLSIHVYDQAHGTILGTKAIKVDRSWRRFGVEGILVAGDTDAGCTIGGDNTWSTGEIIYGDHAGAIVNDEWRTGMGVYHDTGTVNKPTHDLIPGGSPTPALSGFQGADGNKLRANEYDVADSDNHQKVHHENFNMFTKNHTITFVANVPVGTVGNGQQLRHVSVSDGIIVRLVATQSQAEYFAGGPVIFVRSVTHDPMADGLDHVHQIVRDDSSGTPMSTYFIDGIAGTPVDVTGGGTDVTASFFVPYILYTGKNTYHRIDNVALSEDELAKERQDFLGMGLGSNDPDWTFTRATTAMKEFDVGTASARNPKLVNVASGIPRVTDGVLIEAQATNEAWYSRRFDSWGNINCVVTTEDHISPDGTLTMDKLENTIGGNNGRREMIRVLNPGNGDIWTASVSIRADIPHNVELRMIEDGVGGDSVIKYIGNEVQRIQITRTMTGGGGGNVILRLFPGESGVATGVIHAWEAQLEEGPYTTSNITTPTNVAVTRLADSLTIDPHPANTTEKIFSEFPTELTIQFDAKCLWADNTEIDGNIYILDIGGATGVATASRNRIVIYALSTGHLRVALYDNVGSLSYFTTTNVNVTDYSEKFTVKAYLDFTDLSRSNFWINRVSDNSVSGMTGSRTLDTTNSLIRIGQSQSGAVSADCKFENLIIQPYEF